MARKIKHTGAGFVVNIDVLGNIRDEDNDKIWYELELLTHDNWSGEVHFYECKVDDRENNKTVKLNPKNNRIRGMMMFSSGSVGREVYADLLEALILSGFDIEWYIYDSF